MINMNLENKLKQLSQKRNPSLRSTGKYKGKGKEQHKNNVY
jgi:hypothetical protein